MNGADYENMQIARRHAEGQRDAIERRLARIEALLEALLLHQGFAVTPTAIISPVRITKEDD